jgi:hypothetical protein
LDSEIFFVHFSISPFQRKRRVPALASEISLLLKCNKKRRSVRKNGIIPNVQTDAIVGFPKPWTVTGYLLLSGSAIFVGRIVYEETILTRSQGPQMIGFAMAHGAVPFISIAGLIGLVGGFLWIVASFVLLIRKRFRIPLTDWIPMALLLVFAALLLIPYQTWEELTVRIAGPGPHGNEFMVEAAAYGNHRMVEYFLRKGFDINYEGDIGATPLSAAAVMGNKEMVSFLVSRGANVNRKGSLTGESALMGAAESGKFETVKALLENGADPCATDKEGRTAAGSARKYRHADIADYLSTRFHCQETIIDSCADPSVSACVHP